MPTLHTYDYVLRDAEKLKVGMQTMRGNTNLVATRPVEVGSARQLLMDRHVADDLNGCVRRVHQPVKRAEGPVIDAEHPWEDAGPTSFGTVLREPESGLYRMWTSIGDSQIMKERGKVPEAKRGHYYESEDGLSWRRPELGLYACRGTTANNIFLSGGIDNLFVLALPQRMRDRGRYAMIYSDPFAAGADPAMHNARHALAFSDDGMDWAAAAESPIWYGRSDTSNCIVYNPERDVFMMYRRATVNAGEVRRIAYSESPDLITWTQPINLFGHDELDPTYHYGMPVSRYNGMYLGYLFRLHVHPRFQHGEMLPDGRDGKMDTELAWSRDGVHWERHALRPAFIPNAPPVEGSPDWGFAQGMANLMTCGDTVRVYYGGRAYLHSPARAFSDPMRRSICLATLQRDRFVSIHAGDDGGFMLTRPLAHPGGRLHINGRTTGDGFIKVAVREGEGVRDGEWPEGWHFDHSTPFCGDSLDHAMAWRGAVTLDTFPSRTLRLHFWLENADLYSFWIEP